MHRSCDLVYNRTHILMLSMAVAALWPSNPAVVLIAVMVDDRQHGMSHKCRIGTLRVAAALKDDVTFRCAQRHDDDHHKDSLLPSIGPTVVQLYSCLVRDPSLAVSHTMNQALLDAIEAMNSGKNFFDVTIICTTDEHQAKYWMERLRSGLLAVNDSSSLFPMVLAVSEDWNSAGGAGNGLGTLYAFQKASALDALLKGTVSASLYHTAGKGTRMAPLPASENNNKPGVVSSLF